MDGYLQDLPGFIKLLNNYIVESGNNRKFRKTFLKEQTVVTFNQTKEKDSKYKKNMNSKGGGLTVSTADISIIGQRFVQI